jgi:ubiquinone/menaquinone biosynthesis C-methylase UbiE
MQREWHDRAHLNCEEEYKKSTYTDKGLFPFLLYYQLREVEGLLTTTKYSRIANIGCGHGFELDFLALFGKHVILADISLKSLQRAITKARQLGMHVQALCCDAENLPLRDNICDLVLTHHSLHHLDNPMAGLEEMIRISNSRIAFFEPVEGIMRTIVRATGLKPRVEESGNVVYEFSQKKVREISRRSGAALRYFGKCLVTGPTSEPRMFRRLDASRISPAICSSITLANRLFGRVIGTKCSVVIDKIIKQAHSQQGPGQQL